jgi:hypothetical protein
MYYPFHPFYSLTDKITYINTQFVELETIYVIRQGLDEQDLVVAVTLFALSFSCLLAGDSSNPVRTTSKPVKYCI